MDGSFQFKVPATCAHLGPGFGVLGVAVDVALTVEVEPTGAIGFEIIRHGEVSHARFFFYLMCPRGNVSAAHEELQS